MAQNNQIESKPVKSSERRKYVAVEIPFSKATEQIRKKNEEQESRKTSKNKSVFSKISQIRHEEPTLAKNVQLFNTLKDANKKPKKSSLPRIPRISFRPRFPMP